MSGKDCRMLQKKTQSGTLRYPGTALLEMEMVVANYILFGMLLAGFLGVP